MNDELSLDPADLIGESPPGVQRLCHVGSVSGLDLPRSSHFHLEIWEVQLCQCQCQCYRHGGIASGGVAGGSALFWQ